MSEFDSIEEKLDRVIKKLQLLEDSLLKLFADGFISESVNLKLNDILSLCEEKEKLANEWTNLILETP